MFTGIIEEIGTIRGISRGSSRFVLDIGCREVLMGSKEGDSIAVNGVCLTVTSLTGNGFTADVMPETVHRSNISLMRQGSCVNLERAMAADGRFGGHIVSGHVDGMGMIREIREELVQAGYVRPEDKGRRKPRPLSYAPRAFTVAGGFTVLCGRNNRENDELTHRRAGKNDIWFHARNVPGSHAVLFTQGREPSDEALRQADDAMSNSMNALTGGLNIPGLGL